MGLRLDRMIAVVPFLYFGEGSVGALAIVATTVVGCLVPVLDDFDGVSAAEAVARAEVPTFCDEQLVRADFSARHVLEWV